MALARGEKLLLKERYLGEAELLDNAKALHHEIKFVDPITKEDRSRLEYRVYKTISGLKRGEVLNLRTEEKFEKQGLASKLLDTAIRKMEEEGVNFVVLSLSPERRSLKHAEKLYRKKGFVPVSELPKETAIKLLGKEEYEAVMKHLPDRVLVKIL